MQKNIRNKQDELTQFITIEKTKANPNQDKIQEAHQHLQDIDNYKISGSIIRSKEKMILEQEKPNKFFFDQEKQKQKQKTIKQLQTIENDKIITDNYYPKNDKKEIGGQSLCYALTIKS